MWDPKWYKGMNYRSLVPKKYDPKIDCETCVEQNGYEFSKLDCHYLSNYNKQLSRYNQYRTLMDVIEKADRYYNFSKCAINGEIIIAFVGFEVPSKKCSERFTLANWFMSDEEVKDDLVSINEF